jgi:hypothetical protein
MTAKGVRKCRAEDSEENQNQVSHCRPRALGNRCAIPTFPQPRPRPRGKVEIQKQDYHFPTATVPIKSIKNERRSTPARTLSFRLISGLEYADPQKAASTSGLLFASAWRTSLGPQVPISRGKCK